MAIAAIAGLAAAGGYAAGALVAGTFAWAAAATAFAIGAGLSVISRALMPKPDFGALMKGITTTVREPTASRKVIYGKVRVGGAVVFITNSNANKDLYLVICFACHEIEGYEAVYFNDKKVWETGTGYLGDWGNYADFAFYDGTQTAVDPVLDQVTSFWGSNHILNDIAYIRVKLTWDEDRKKFPQGVPNITAVIKGKKLYDTRNGVTAWSQNPALALYDYFTNSYYGLGESSSNIDEASFSAAANLADQQIALDEGGTHDRYHCDGAIDTANSIKGNIEALLACMGGRVGYVNGKYFVQAAEYSAPTITIDESHMVGAMTIQTKQSRREMYNGVKGVFLSEEENYTLVDYPAKISSTYSAQDGDPIFLDMTLPFVTNNVRAQRLAKIALLKSRQQTLVTVPLNLAALRFKAGDFIGITSARMGWVSKDFEVLGYDLRIGSQGEIIVNVQAIETASAVYDWTASLDQDPFNSPTLPSNNFNDGTTVAAPTNLVVTETTELQADGSILPALQISWTLADDGFIDRYEIEVVEVITGVEQTDQTIFNSVKADVDSLLIVGVRAGQVTYRVKVRAVNVTGVRSTDLVSTTLFTLSGDQDAPSAPTSLSAIGSYKQIALTWSNPADLDLKEIEIHRATSSGGTFSKIAVTTGESYVDQILTLETTRYYKVKAVDYSGNISGFSNEANGTTTKIDQGEFTNAVENLFANANVKQVEVVSSLPASGDYVGQVVFLTTDSLIYRWTGVQWLRSVPAVDITGQLTDAQIAAISAAKLTGTITSTQITDGAITTPKIGAGAVSANEIAANAIVADKIAANAITSAKIQAGAVTATEIAGNTITGNKIVANTITGGLLATAGIITSAAQIDDAVITTAKIGNAQVDTLKIAGQAVTIPVGTAGGSNVTLNTTFQQIGTVRLDWGSGEKPSAAIALAGLDTAGGTHATATAQTLSLTLRRLYPSGNYTGVAVAGSFDIGYGGAVNTGFTFDITTNQVETYVDFVILAKVNIGTRPADAYYIAVMSSKR